MSENSSKEEHQSEDIDDSPAYLQHVNELISDLGKVRGTRFKKTNRNYNYLS